MTTSDLCKSCGLCCDGTLFPTVHLQLPDSAQALKGLGMLIRHKKKYDFFTQPCSSFKKNCCSIYAQRPTRCQLFECKQIRMLNSGETTQQSAVAILAEAHTKVAYFKQLLKMAGHPNVKNPLIKQYEQITAEPLHSSADTQAITLRAKITETFHNLQLFFKQNFYNE